MSLDEQFWTARPHLGALRDFARARMVGPWALLGVVLTRAVSAADWRYQFPATIGGHGSPNLFIALVGPSGGGKGAAERAAEDAVDFVDGEADSLVAAEMPIGSGQGLRRAYMRPPTKEEISDDPDIGPVWVRRSCRFSAAEVDSLAALGSGTRGSVLMPELRKLWSGESIGAANASDEARVIVPAMKYRATLVIGVQPARAGALLTDADGGTPQRIAWLPVGDPDAPDVDLVAEALPDVAVPPPEKLVIVDVCSTARRAIKEERRSGLRSDPWVSVLDGHKLQVRLKIAYGLALLDSRPREVSEEDWRLAGVVMAVSDRTRAGVERGLRAQRRKANRAAANEQADREEIVADRAEARIAQRVRDGVLRRLRRAEYGEWVSRGDLRSALAGNLRMHMDVVVGALIDAGTVVRRSTGRSDEYQIGREAAE